MIEPWMMVEALGVMAAFGAMIFIAVRDAARVVRFFLPGVPMPVAMALALSLAPILLSVVPKVSDVSPLMVAISLTIPYMAVKAVAAFARALAPSKAAPAVYLVMMVAGVFILRLALQA
jgi:hypothetical protein